MNQQIEKIDLDEFVEKYRELYFDDKAMEYCLVDRFSGESLLLEKEAAYQWLRDEGVL